MPRAFSAINRCEDDCYIIYSNILIKNGSNIRLKKYPNIRRFMNEYGGAPFIHHQSAFVLRKALLRVGLFDVAYRLHADYDLMLRVMGEGSVMKIDDAFVVFNANGYSSKFGNIIRSFNEIRRIRKKLGFDQLNFKIFLIYTRLILRSIIARFFIN